LGGEKVKWERRGGRRPKQLMDVLKGKEYIRNMKKEALDRATWTISFHEVMDISHERLRSAVNVVTDLSTFCLGFYSFRMRGE
jgi:hypothetical protein